MVDEVIDLFIGERVVIGHGPEVAAMRVSVDKDDPGRGTYEALLASGKTVHVFLNGTEVKDAVTADAKLGIVSHYKRDDDGNLFVDAKGFLRLQHTKGDVTIEARDRII
ncbi:hypothetical protein AB3480_00455 [Rhizobium mongolense]|uniref:hypothetical protein n=1 Tax=Rhizobium mongolense TaxID=57676 RepID=UPI0034A12B91